jgi:hypothetical protein
MPFFLGHLSYPQSDKNSDALHRADIRSFALCLQSLLFSSHSGSMVKSLLMSCNLILYLASPLQQRKTRIHTASSAVSHLVSHLWTIPPVSPNVLSLLALKGVSRLVSHAFLPATGADSPDSPSATALHSCTCRQNNQGWIPAIAADCPVSSAPDKPWLYRPSVLLLPGGQDWNIGHNIRIASVAVLYRSSIIL